MSTYVVRSMGGEAKKMYLAYPGCLRDHGFNVSPELKLAKRCSLNRARKDGKIWFLHEGYEIRKLVFFGWFTRLVEKYPPE